MSENQISERYGSHLLKFNEKLFVFRTASDDFSQTNRFPFLQQ